MAALSCYAIAVAFLATGVGLRWRLRRARAAGARDAGLLEVGGYFSLGAGLFLFVLTLMCRP
jgi:hypothetical protein